MRRLLPTEADLGPDDLVEAYALPSGTAPHVRVGFVSSADGAAAVGGHSAPLSSPADQQILSLLRDLSDVVLVGAGTIRQEGYTALGTTPRRAARRQSLGLSPVPPLAIVTTSLDLDPGAPLFSGPARTVLITTEAAPAERRAALAPVADILTCGAETLDVPAAVTALAGHGLPHILCEGGARLFGALQAADLVDELCLTLSPHLTGAGAGRVVRDSPERQRRLRLHHVLQDDDALFLRYRRVDAENG